MMTSKREQWLNLAVQIQHRKAAIFRSVLEVLSTDFHRCCFPVPLLSVFYAVTNTSDSSIARWSSGAFSLPTTTINWTGNTGLAIANRMGVFAFCFVSLPEPDFLTESWLWLQLFVQSVKREHRAVQEELLPLACGRLLGHPGSSTGPHNESPPLPQSSVTHTIFWALTLLCKSTHNCHS